MVVGYMVSVVEMVEWQGEIQVMSAWQVWWFDGKVLGIWCGYELQRLGIMLDKLALVVTFSIKPSSMYGKK